MQIWEKNDDNAKSVQVFLRQVIVFEICPDWHQVYKLHFIKLSKHITHELIMNNHLKKSASLDL